MPWTERLPSGLYRACWRDAAGRQRSRSGFSQDAEARRYAGEQETLARGGGVSYQGRSVTWGQWQTAWLGLRAVERSTSASDATRLSRWVEPRWGSVPLARITGEDVQRWVNELSRDMAPASVAKVYGLLRSSMKAAVQHRRIAVSPCRDIVLPVVPPPDERFLTRGEFDAALEFLAEPYRTAAIVLVGTGMRFGEMAGLHHARIDWQSKTIDVHETWDGERVKAYPKGRRKRRVPMVSWVESALLEFPSSARSCRLPHAGSRCRSDLVLRGPAGAPLDAHNMLARHWAPALRRAGLEHARQHDLRHTTASWLAQSGRSMTEIAAILGHSETAVTARYAHLAGTHMASVRAALEGAAPSSPLDLVPHDLRQVAVGQ